MNEFGSVAEFALHLMSLEARIMRRTEAGLELASRLVEKEAKSEIGSYQDAIGPFDKWAELAESTQADREAHGYPATEPLLRSGAMRDSIGHEVHGSEAIVGSMSKIALYQEVGTAKIPPRSFLGAALLREQDKVEEILGASLVSALTGAMPAIG